MNYKITLLPIAKLVTNSAGPITPLCQSCNNKDCPLPIIVKSISIFGVNKQMRVHSYHNRESFVVECEGYMNEEVETKEHYELRAISEIQEADGKGDTKKDRAT